MACLGHWTSSLDLNSQKEDQSTIMVRVPVFDLFLACNSILFFFVSAFQVLCILSACSTAHVFLLSYLIFGLSGFAVCLCLN